MNDDNLPPPCCHKTMLLIFVVFPQIYELRVMETKPDKAVSIIECDMNVSTFDAYSALGSREDGQLMNPAGQCPMRVSCSPEDCLGEREGS